MDIHGDTVVVRRGQQLAFYVRDPRSTWTLAQELGLGARCANEYPKDSVHLGPDTLVVDGKDKDRSCVGCHSVGFGEPGGPCKTSDVARLGLGGVQCESCHGPGSKHAATSDPRDLVRVPDEALCRSCHHVPHIPTTDSFVMRERLRRILGKGHGEARFKKLMELPQ